MRASTLTPLMAALAVVAATGCGGGLHKANAVGRPAMTSAPRLDAPVFVPVPADENTSLVRAEEAEAAARRPYTIEVEDELDISVYGEPDLQHVEIPVRPDGMISFAFIGDVMAASRTVQEVRAEITERLGQYLRSPQVTVIAKSFGQKRVYVGGEVRSPGVLSLGAREGTLIDALYKAGLVTEKADLESAYIMRGNKVVAADFDQLVRGNLSHNVRLVDQDIVFVPENVRRYVYVLGEVGRNDALEVTQPVPIIEIIARAGGFKQYAKMREIAVIRGGLKAPQVATIDAKSLIGGDFSQNITVEPGDIVFVSNTALGKYMNFIDIVLRTISPVVQGVIVSNQVNP